MNKSVGPPDFQVDTESYAEAHKVYLENQRLNSRYYELKKQIKKEEEAINRKQTFCKEIV